MDEQWYRDGAEGLLLLLFVGFVLLPLSLLKRLFQAPR
jgi:hypothetical protein